MASDERRAQFEAARALLLRDGDGGLERFFRGRGVGGIALEQDFAADAMQFGFERAMAGPLGRRQRFVEDRDGAIDVAGAGFGFGKRNLDEPVEEQDVLLAQKFDAATHVLEPVAEPRRFQPSPSPRERPRTLATSADHARARVGRVRAAFGAARERSPRISSNMAACIFPCARVPI